jgi:hypothetical protein
MAAYKPIMAKALRMYYLDNISTKSHAKKLNIPRPHYYLQVQMAKQWLLGRLFSKK